MLSPAQLEDNKTGGLNPEADAETCQVGGCNRPGTDARYKSELNPRKLLVIEFSRITKIRALHGKGSTIEKTRSNPPC